MTLSQASTECRVGVAVADRSTMTSADPYRESSVSHLVHEAIMKAGYGQANAEAPLGDVIEPGMTVLIKPNWVLHYNHGGYGMDCMVTHPSLIEALLDEVLKVDPGKVLVGDAPIQLCDFGSVVSPQWALSLQQRAPGRVDVLDFRRAVAFGADLAGGMKPDVRPLEHYVLFDLRSDSILDPVSRRVGQFRVTNYDPRALARTHGPGQHQYLICREALEADVVITVPKLKTHRKVGLTGALKNLVGINGNKDYLPHHRVGGSLLNGDCYRGLSPIRRLAEYCLDRANVDIGGPGYVRWQRRFRSLMRMQRRLGDTDVEGNWHGNDTAWRMVLDLNRVLLYGTVDGSLANSPLRRVYSLTDAIVAGQGEGPLAPEPLPLGVITFATSPVFADLVHASLLRFDPTRVPLVWHAFDIGRYPLTRAKPSDCRVHLGEREMVLDEVAATLGRDATPPGGWRGHIEARALRDRACNSP